jgi:hypothetical protein
MKKFALTLLSIIAICFIGYCGLSLTKTTTEPTLIFRYGAQYEIKDNPDIAFYIEWDVMDGVPEDEVMEMDIIVSDVLYKTSNVAMAIDTLKSEFNKRNIECSKIRCELVHRKINE